MYSIIQGFIKRITRETTVVSRHVVLDTAIFEAKKLSKPGYLQIYAVLDTDLADIQVRGWAEGGVWKWAKGCHKCGGSGSTGSGWEAKTCQTCQGTGMTEDCV